MTAPRWLSAAEHTTWIRLAAVLELLPAALDSQLTRDEKLSHFDYFTLAMLSEAPDRVLRMTALAARTNASLQRLSRVVSRLEADGYVSREPCPEDRRATNARLTPEGWRKVQGAAPGHVEAVRSFAIDPLSDEQVLALGEIARVMLERLDPEGRMSASDE